MDTFNELPLIDDLRRAVAAEGYSRPTPIQAQAIPPLLAGRDLLASAQTGTGKTAAFALPILQRLSEAPRKLVRRACRVLVLAPTRELAAQIGDSFRAYGRHLPLRTAVIFGGVGQGPQVQRLAGGVDVLVATPGRLLDLVAQKHLQLGQLEILVLDEADRMLDMGFIHDIRKVLALVPQARQTLLFSATMPAEIARLAATILRTPVQVSVAPVSSTAERIDQRVYLVERPAKRALLARLLQDGAIARAVVFTRTKHGADKVARDLAAGGVSADAIHGNKSQGARERALAGFKTGSVRILVATDIAARGIDVDGITHVINFDMPVEPEAYVHRIGRTARAGAAGAAISFCSSEERPLLRAVEKVTRQSIAVAPPMDPAGPAAPAPALETLPAREHRTQDTRRPAGRWRSPGRGRGRGGRQRSRHAAA